MRGTNSQGQSIERDAYAALASHVRVRTFDGELILLDSEGGEYFALNTVGAAFVRSLEGGCSVEQSARRLHAEYDVAWESLYDDLLELFRELVSRRLVVPRAVGSAVVEDES